MSDRAERILDLIDGGLQSSSEAGFGNDSRSRCARCQRNDPAEGGDLCDGCRAFLLEDSDVDPRRPATGLPLWSSSVLEAVQGGDQRFVAQMPRSNHGAPRPVAVTHDGEVVGYVSQFVVLDEAVEVHGVITDEGFAAAIAGTMEGITVAVAEVSDNLQRFADEVASAFGVSEGSALNLVRRLRDVWAPAMQCDIPALPQAASEPARVERLRHGRSAVCPRHGPTRGGTCMTCARGRR